MALTGERERGEIGVRVLILTGLFFIFKVLGSKLFDGEVLCGQKGEWGELERDKRPAGFAGKDGVF